MTERFSITPRKFELLLEWLDEDRERAAEKYNSIHQRLVQIFLARNAYPAEDLADRTIDIAIQKIRHIKKEYEGDPALYIYGIASNVFHESLRKSKDESFNDQVIHKEDKQEDKEEDIAYYECIKSCLGSLPRPERKLIKEYFQYEKINKKFIKNRKKRSIHKKILEESDADVNTIRTRIYRIKLDIEKCVKKCLRKKSL
jgi:DNA-directed RNA polymerase specialized sigma24 family protein